MTLPDVQACPNCGRSIKVRPKNCPGCGFAIRAYRIRETIGDRTKIVDRVVAIPPEHADKFEVAGDVVEELLPRDAGEDERIRVARARLNRAIERYKRALSEDNALKTDDSRREREAAVVEMSLASKKLADMISKERGL